MPRAELHPSSATCGPPRLVPWWVAISHSGLQRLRPLETLMPKNMTFMEPLTASIHSVIGRGSSNHVKNSFLHYWLWKIMYIFHLSYELENYQWVNTSVGSHCPFTGCCTSFPEISWVTQIRLHGETPAPAEIPALQGFISSDFLMPWFKKNNTAPWAGAVQPPRRSATGRKFVPTS